MHRVNLNLHEIFQALSDPYRIRVISLLLKADEEICLCEFSESLREPEYKLSRHVKILKSCGLLAAVRDGKWIYHSLVKNQKYLKLIYSAIEKFPDDGKVMESDFKSFKKRTLQREQGRCRTQSKISDELKNRKSGATK